MTTTAALPILQVAKALGMDELENVCCAKIASRVAMWTFQQQEVRAWRRAHHTPAHRPP